MKSVFEFASHFCEGAVSAKTWVGEKVEARTDSGWGDIPGYTGIAAERRGWLLEEGWFNLVNDEYPEGILAHTQEFYSPIKRELTRRRGRVNNRGGVG